MTDNRNTILAVILSGIVLIGWQYFYNIPQMEKQRAQQAQSEAAKPAPQPGGRRAGHPAAGAHATPPATAAQSSRPRCRWWSPAKSRSPPTPRIKIETPKVTGSISLKGARIDDLALTQYRITVDPKSPAIVLFSPSGTANALLCGIRLGAGDRLADPAARPATRLAAGRLGQPGAAQPGDAEIRQWRRPHIPPHHRDRRELSVHHQGRRQECRQRAGHAVSVRADLAARHPEGRGLLHPA